MLQSRRLGSDAQLQKASANAPSLRRGAQGSGVGQLQDLLADLGFSLAKSFAKQKGPDGIFGPETEAAVKQFQSRSGLTADGVAGAKTLAALDAVIARNPALEAPSPIGEAAVVAFNASAPLNRKRTALT